MSTRGAIGFRLDGKDLVTYNHTSSDPPYLGKAVVEFAKSYTVQQMKEAAQVVELVEEDEKPTKQHISECGKYIDTGGSTDTWYDLLRSAQGDLSVHTKGLKYMMDYQSFLYSSLFCEHAYIINLDTEELEYYVGFNKNPKAPGRYAEIPEEYKDPEDDRYAGVALADTVPLAKIREMEGTEIEKLIMKWGKLSA